MAKKDKPVAAGSVVPVYDFEGDGEDTSNRALVKEEEGGDYLESGGLDFTGSSYSQYGYQDAIGILPSDFSPKGHLFTEMPNINVQFEIKVYQVVVESVPIVRNGYRPRYDIPEIFWTILTVVFKVKRHVEDRHLPRATPCTVCTKV